MEVYLRSNGPSEARQDPTYTDDDPVPEAGARAVGAGPNPAATARTTLVRNPDDGSLLLFGGHSGGDIIGQLWRYRPDSGRWEKLTPQGGPVRGGHSAVWDPGRGEMIVFGGVNNLEEDTNDIYTYTPAEDRWRHISPGIQGPQPRPRKDHTAVWDPVRGQMLVFGGHAQPDAGNSIAVTNELWAWRPAEERWVQLDPPGPRPDRRHGHSAVWDPVGERMLVFGGYDFMSPHRFNDLWSYDPKTNTWNQLDGNDPDPGNRKPFPRERQRAVWDTAKSRMLLYGGCCGSADVMNDFWAYDPRTNAWEPIRVDGVRPTARELFAVAWDPVQAEMILFGGWGHCWPLGDMWVYRSEANAWRRLDLQPAGVPPALEGHTAVWDAAGDQMLIFGGCDNSRRRQELWSYRPADDTFVQLSPEGEAPRPRAKHMAAWDPAGRRMLIFGGHGQEDTMNDLWAYEAEQNRWQQLAAGGSESDLTNRYYGSAVWDPGRDQMIIVGGRTTGGEPAEVWGYRAVDGRWTLLGNAATGGRDWQRAVWDERQGRMLVFGGFANDPTGSGRWPTKHWGHDVWSYDPATAGWSELPSDPPVAPEILARYGQEFWNRFHPLPQGAVVVWDPVREQMLMFGGFVHEFDAGGNAYAAFTGQLWAYSPAEGRWTRLQAAGKSPPGRLRSAAVWDSTRSQMLVFGGLNSDRGLLNDLWAYDPGANRWTELTPTLVEPQPKLVEPEPGHPAAGESPAPVPGTAGSPASPDAPFGAAAVRWATGVALAVTAGLLALLFHRRIVRLRR